MDKKEFCREIVECMVQFGKLSTDAAQLLFSHSNISAIESDEDFDVIAHETPYYWAMWLMYSKDMPNWHNNPDLWPPPRDYLDRWYGSNNLE